MKLRNKFLSLAMSLVLLGGNSSQTNVSAAEIVNTVPAQGANVSSQLISALQMVYSCKNLREIISSSGTELGQIFTRMDAIQKEFSGECEIEIPPSLGEIFKDTKTTVDIMKKIFTDLEIDEFENNIHQINELTPDLLTSLDSDFFFITNNDGQEHSDIPTALEKDGKIFELKSINVDRGDHDAVCLKFNDDWVVIEYGKVMPIGKELNQFFCSAKLRNALYCKKESGFSGLGNSGNSCYFNAVLQQLNNCKSFREIIHNFATFGIHNDMIDKLNILFSSIEGNSVVPRATMAALFGQYINHEKGDSSESALDTIFNGVKEDLDGRYAIDLQNRGIDYYGMSYFTQRPLMLDPNPDLINNIFNFLTTYESIGNNVLLSLESFCPPDQKFVVNCPDIIATTNGTVYSLKSMVVNVGGHYVSWVCDQEDTWYCISDSTVRQPIQGLDNVLQQINQANQKIFSVLYSKV